MEKKKKSGASEWIDPDDAPEITEEMLTTEQTGTTATS